MSLAEALAAHRRGDLATARRLYEALLADQPGHADALHLLAVLDGQEGQVDAALAGFDRALAVAPGLAAAWSNRSALLRDAGRLAEALASAERALALQPDDARALNNRAAALLDLGRAGDALPSAERSLALDPRDPAAQHNHGKALLALGRTEAALRAFEQALALAPTLAASRAGRIDALAALGEAQLAAGRGVEALTLLQQALEEAPDTPFLFGRWLDARLKLCDWDGLDAALATLVSGLDAGRALATPFVALHLPLSLAQQQRAARLFSATLAAEAADRPPDPPPAPDGRLRVGFFSADFREHATARLSVGLIEQLDRTRVEATAYAFGPPADDALRARLQAAFEHFVDVSALDDAAVVRLARERGLQIALDLGGPTRGARPGLFARRLAPLQVAWLAYPGTQGARWIDALIADAVVVPPAHAPSYDEALLRLPHSYQANDPRRPRAAAPPRAALGLPAEGFVFCAFHAPAKIEPEVFAVWMRLLRQRPGSVLWLLQPDARAAANLRRAAAAHGIAVERLVFAPWLPPAAHLARLGAADLFLDTFVCNAHTTASDALWAGVPVLTRPGGSFAARVAASLLRAARLPELIAPDSVAYEALALELSMPGSRLAGLRARLTAHPPTLPLFDSRRFARAFEAALSALWHRHAAGLPTIALQVLEDVGGDLRVVEQPPVAEAARADEAAGT